MGIDFGGLADKAKGLINEHGDKIEDGLEKAGEFAKQKFGHEEQIDGAVDKLQELIPDKPQQDGENNA
ncbi:antitoxin [Actinocrispum sp. NPDC049592]|uniref:antitoxin n=1 Tax=Actinocrispum sp. NPDC049592 TaxID=3154835 RepID=UPI003449ECF1